MLFPGDDYLIIPKRRRGSSALIAPSKPVGSGSVAPRGFEPGANVVAADMACRTHATLCQLKVTSSFQTQDNFCALLQIGIRPVLISHAWKEINQYQMCDAVRASSQY